MYMLYSARPRGVNDRQGKTQKNDVNSIGSIQIHFLVFFLYIYNIYPVICSSHEEIQNCLSEHFAKSYYVYIT